MKYVFSVNFVSSHLRMILRKMARTHWEKRKKVEKRGGERERERRGGEREGEEEGEIENENCLKSKHRHPIPLKEIYRKPFMLTDFYVISFWLRNAHRLLYVY